MADISKYALVVYAAAIGGFVYAPISTMVLFSFNSSSRTVPSGVGQWAPVRNMEEWTFRF